MPKEERITTKEIIEDEIKQDNHPSYEKFEQGQFIMELDKGDIVEILVNDEIVKTWVAKNGNSHINLVYQSKEGVK